MDLGLAGKVALVSGASRGLGRAAAERLAAEGARVAMSARSAGTLGHAAAAVAAAGVRVNNVLPGWIASDRTATLAKAEAAERGIGVEAVYAEQAAAIPM